MVNFAGIKALRGKFRMVGRIGKSLTFKRYGAIIGIDCGLFPCGGACKPVAGVDLHPGLIGQNGESAAGYWIVKNCRALQFARSGHGVESPAVVVPFGVA